MLLKQQRLLVEASNIKIPLPLNCAYCSTMNNVPLSLVEDNMFKCAHCSAPNKVYIQFTTVRITEPVISEAYKESAKVDKESTSYPLSTTKKEKTGTGEVTTIRQTTINEPITITRS